MIDYTEFDKAILEAIKEGRTHFHELNCGELKRAGDALATPNRHGNRNGWRIIDRRLQALRKKGVLNYSRATGWGVNHV